MVIKNSEEARISQAKIFKGKHDSSMISRVVVLGDSNQKTICEGYGYFLEPRIKNKNPYHRMQRGPIRPSSRNEMDITRGS